MNLSLWASLAGWIFLDLLTVTLVIAAWFLWPFSLIFEHGKGTAIHGVSQTWAKVIARVLPFWEIKVEGLERIQKGRPYVVVSNHQSMLDILVALARLPLHFKFISKRELFWIPFFGWHLALAGYIALKRGDPKSGHSTLEKAREWLRKDVSVLFFPEGTRSPDGEIHEFKPGAFKLAIEEKIDLLPVVMAGTRDAIPKHSWYVKKRSTLGLRILQPLSTGNLTAGDLNDFRDKVRKQIVSEFQKFQPAAR